MKRLLAAMSALLLFSCHPVPAGAAEQNLPPRIAGIRATFLAAVVAKGMNPAKCSFSYHKSGDEEFIATECDGLPLACIFQVHPSRDELRVLQCVENPNYRDESKDLKVDGK